MRFQILNKNAAQAQSWKICFVCLIGFPGTTVRLTQFTGAFVLGHDYTRGGFSVRGQGTWGSVEPQKRSENSLQRNWQTPIEIGLPSRVVVPVRTQSQLYGARQRKILDSKNYSQWVGAKLGFLTEKRRSRSKPGRSRRRRPATRGDAAKGGG